MNGSFFENVLGHLNEAVFVLDKHGALIYVNNYFLRNAILTRDEILQLNSNSLFDTGKSDVNIWRMVQDQKQEITAVQTIFSHDAEGRTMSYLVTQTPILDEHGEVELHVGVMRNVAEYQERFTRASTLANGVYQPKFQAAPTRPGTGMHPVYQSTQMAELFHTADAIAASDATVLISGESGTGKEVLANYIHRRSGRSEKKMVTINCAALNESLLESELFGYEKGSFTGALASGKAGLIEEANGGTLFLDEIDSFPLALQAKLLRVLETHEVRPLGSQKNIRVDFRVIAATNADLEERVRQHQFREDLYYRLNILPLTLPPLRQRAEDIPLLADYFLRLFGQKYGRHKRLSPMAVDQLTGYRWPGNVRELRNCIERLVLITDLSVSEIKTIPEVFFRPEQTPAPDRAESAPPAPEQSCLHPGRTLKDQVAEHERLLIDQAVARYGSLSKAAAALGVTKSTLIRKRKR